MYLGKGVVALFTESLLLSHQVGLNLVDEDLFTQVPRTDLCWGGLVDIAEVTEI